MEEGQFSPSAPSSRSPQMNSQLQEVLGLELLYHPRRLVNKAASFYPLRRRQLLFQKYSKSAESGNTASIDPNYVLLRQKLLARKFGPPPTLSFGSPHRSLNNITMESHASMNKASEKLAAHEDIQEEPIALGPVSNLKDIYQFSGMAAYFDHHKMPVTTVQFANNSNDLVACASVDGTLSICKVSDQTVLTILKGHESGVVDFEWSTSNGIILSASLDHTIRIWDTKTGECKRIIQEDVEILSCSFYPSNNNLFGIGNKKGEVKIFNMSTGKVVTSAIIGGNISCKTLCFDPYGRFVFAGDDTGFVHVLGISSISVKLSKLSKYCIAQDKAITSVSCSECHSHQRNDILLLVNCIDNQLHILSLVSSRNNLLKERQSFAIHHQQHDIRSSFCPLLSIRASPCVVTGTEDMSINIYDINGKRLLNELKGHSAPVLCVCWSFDESLLAASDAMGSVIIWRRQE